MFVRRLLVPCCVYEIATLVVSNRLFPWRSVSPLYLASRTLFLWSSYSSFKKVPVAVESGFCTLETPSLLDSVTTVESPAPLAGGPCDPTVLWTTLRLLRSGCSSRSTFGCARICYYSLRVTARPRLCEMYRECTFFSESFCLIRELLFCPLDSLLR